MIAAIYRRGAAFWNTIGLAVVLSCTIVACMPSQEVRSDLFKALDSYKAACPQNLDTPACGFAAEKLRAAAESLNEARRDPSDAKLIAAAAAVDEAVNAVHALKPATVDAGS